MEDKNGFTVMKDLQGYFKEGERKAIYNAAESYRDKVLIRLLWVTGRRINEVLRIKVSEIDFELKAITIHVEKKTKKIKDEYGDKIKVKNDLLSLSYIDEKTINILKHFIISNHLQSNDFIFKSEFNPVKPITRQRAFAIIRKASSNAGIDKVGNRRPHPHHFRHSFAVDMARKMKTPADVRKLQIAMDHSNLGVTEQYLKFADQEIREFIQDIGD